MKKVIVTSALSAMLMFSSCATVFSGRLTDHQKNKPLPGEPKREVKWELVATDVILFFPYGLIGLGVDFLTGAIYRPLRDNYGRKIYETEKSTSDQQNNKPE